MKHNIILFEITNLLLAHTKKETSYKKHHKNIRSWLSGTEVMGFWHQYRISGQYPNKNSISEAPFSVLGKRSISNKS